MFRSTITPCNFQNLSRHHPYSIPPPYKQACNKIQATQPPLTTLRYSPISMNLAEAHTHPEPGSHVHCVCMESSVVTEFKNHEEVL
ncbi:hypothetical protein HanIR_Chr11g0505591 [Helianthus annuus]|nr:hypothetical protein HanIR_Chr11g0505591 [Helianthus annuus]